MGRLTENVHPNGNVNINVKTAVGPPVAAGKCPECNGNLRARVHLLLPQMYLTGLYHIVGRAVVVRTFARPDIRISSPATRPVEQI